MDNRENEGRERDELEALYERVQSDLARERGLRGWLRARPRWARVALVVLAAAVASVLPTMMMDAAPRFGLDGWLFSVLAMVALFGVATTISLRPLYRPEGSSVVRRLGLVGLGVASLLAIVLATDGSIGSVESMRCFMLGAMVGLPVWIVAFLVDRAPQRNAALGGAIGALGGMVAAQLLCPLRGLLHLAVEHFAALVVLAGVFGGGRWLLGQLERRAMLRAALRATPKHGASLR